MFISHKHKFIFIKTTKVAGTSLELYLSKIGGETDIFPPFYTKGVAANFRNYTGFFNPYNELSKKYFSSRVLRKSDIKYTFSDLLKHVKFFESIPAWQLKCRIPKDIWSNYFVFTIERNPWDKCVSRYYHSKSVFEPKYKKELSFKMWYDYFENRINKPWINRAWGSEAPYNYPRYANPWTDEIMVDKICRYEHLEENLSSVFNQLNIPFNGLTE
jgi:hypothetical protein